MVAGFTHGDLLGRLATRYRTKILHSPPWIIPACCTAFMRSHHECCAEQAHDPAGGALYLLSYPTRSTKKDKCHETHAHGPRAHARRLNRLCPIRGDQPARRPARPNWKRHGLYRYGLYLPCIRPPDE
ncbi:hypothetical protein JL2886_01063 [Phaeobacter gallaeciensis]|uniref:Uncharacterized protein n=1 Tax=Phaeobacter gallaeciensis TaxID=60890 RepID=A0A1B0ZPI2_9RHOB|nr:hypothetical protein JL2886_01063 [Phaeobacter gallaeciensis]